MSLQLRSVCLDLFGQAQAFVSAVDTGAALAITMGRLWRRAKGAVLVLSGAFLLATAVTRLVSNAHSRSRSLKGHNEGAGEADVKGGVLGGAPGGIPPEGLYTLSARDIDGAMVPLARYAGRVTLVANVASF